MASDARSKSCTVRKHKNGIPRVWVVYSPLTGVYCCCCCCCCSGIVAVLLGRTNEELNLLKKNYFKYYTKDLGKLLASELHGDMER